MTRAKKELKELAKKHDSIHSIGFISDVLNALDNKELYILSVMLKAEIEKIA